MHTQSDLLLLLLFFLLVWVAKLLGVLASWSLREMRLKTELPIRCNTFVQMMKCDTHRYKRDRVCITMV